MKTSKIRYLAVALIAAILAAFVALSLAGCPPEEEEEGWGTYGDFYYEYTATEVTITGYTGPGGAVTIPVEIDGKPVTAIGFGAFPADKLTSVTIPDSVITIGIQAFYGSGSYDAQKEEYLYSGQLTSVTIPNSVITIGYGAFSGNQLTSVTIPNSVTTIGGGAFSGNQLTSVTIPNSVTTIGEWAFSYNQLTNVTIGNSVTTIGNGAFAENKLTSVTIGNGITSIGDGTPGGYIAHSNGAFYSNPLVSITIGYNLPIDEYSIGDGIGDSYFFKVYHNALRAAGTYTRTDTYTIWTKNP